MQDELRQERALKERAMRERDAAVSDKFSVEQALQVSLPFKPTVTNQHVDHNLQFAFLYLSYQSLFNDGVFFSIENR